MRTRYLKSAEQLKKALTVIPTGAQTFSKSHHQIPPEIGPLFATHANGSRFWDIDGHEYIDFNNALASITLGHAFPEVNLAITEQLQKGSIFSVSSPLELVLSQQLCEIIPSAEMVRFGKNGSDVTTAAIRLARAYTRKDHVLVCGYHGWQDWYISATSRNLGIPEGTQQYTHRFIYNDINSLKQLFLEYPDSIAAVILEPMNTDFPNNHFLSDVKQLTYENNAVLIFDEMVTGFRFSLGGAQEFFNVIPDLACFGKGMANGLPISALVGKKSIMEMVDTIFYSFTFGGELLSIAAANSVIHFYRNHPVIVTLFEQGSKIMTETNEIIRKNNAESILAIHGHPSWSFLSFKEQKNYTAFDLKTYWLQEIFSRGLFSLGTHNMSYSHNHSDIDTLLGIYDELIPNLKHLVDSEKLLEHLDCSAIHPLFIVR